MKFVVLSLLAAAGCSGGAPTVETDTDVAVVDPCPRQDLASLYVGGPYVVPKANLYPQYPWPKQPEARGGRACVSLDAASETFTFTWMEGSFFEWFEVSPPEEPESFSCSIDDALSGVCRTDFSHSAVPLDGFDAYLDYDYTYRSTWPADDQISFEVGVRWECIGPACDAAEQALAPSTNIWPNAFGGMFTAAAAP